MMKLFKKKENTVGGKLSQQTKKLHPELREIFSGKNTVFSVMGFIVGGILFGSSLWVYSTEKLGLLSTMAIGIAIFLVAGISSKAFRK